MIYSRKLNFGFTLAVFVKIWKFTETIKQLSNDNLFENIDPKYFPLRKIILYQFIF